MSTLRYSSIFPLIFLSTGKICVHDDPKPWLFQQQQFYKQPSRFVRAQPYGTSTWNATCHSINYSGKRMKLLQQPVTGSMQIPYNNKYHTHKNSEVRQENKKWSFRWRKGPSASSCQKLLIIRKNLIWPLVLHINQLHDTSKWCLSNKQEKKKKTTPKKTQE